MVSYSPRAAGALAFLKRPFNDIDIFVEDTGNQSMWLTLLRNLLPSNIALASVNMLGGRSNVITACRLDQSNNGRPKLYIIDSDFDHLLGKKKDRLKYLYRIRSYCIENLLVNELALLRVGIPWRPQLTEQAILTQLNHKVSLSDLRTKFEPLFCLYAVAHKLAPDVQTVAYAVNNFYTQTVHGLIIDSIKVRARFKNLQAELAARLPIANIVNEYKLVRKRSRKLDIHRIVSGKDYILPFYLIKLSQILGYRGNIDTLKVHLAAGFESGIEPYFARAVKTAAI